VSAHHYSEDGLNWHTINAEPYSNAIELTTGGEVGLYRNGAQLTPPWPCIGTGIAAGLAVWSVLERHRKQLTARMWAAVVLLRRRLRLCCCGGGGGCGYR